jgi:signal transduction histidine kinase
MDMRQLTGLCDYIDGLRVPSDLRQCCEVPAPVGEDEITRTVRTVTCRLGRLNQALQQQQRFTSDASHELRSPVAGLRAELEEAQLHPDCDDVQDVLDRALNNIGRLEAIINDLLLLSRADNAVPTEREPVDLAKLVQNEVARRRDRLRVELRIVPEANVSTVRVQIIRVLTNLLDNAQRHANKMVQVEVTCDAQTAELSVSDDGEGIAEADRERIFERFSRLDAARSRDCSGTGLGLAIAREIAQAHHGTLDAGNSSIGGARFALRLPLVNRPTAPPSDGDTRTSSGCAGPTHVCGRSSAAPCDLCAFVDHVTESIMAGGFDTG